MKADVCILSVDRAQGAFLLSRVAARASHAHSRSRVDRDGYATNEKSIYVAMFSRYAGALVMLAPSYRAQHSASERLGTGFKHVRILRGYV